MSQENSFFKILLPLLVGIFGIVFYNVAITGFDLRYIPGDGGDARFINYILEHGYQYLNGYNDFWDAPFMYPQKNVLAFSDNMMGTLPLYSFLRLLGNDRETAYQLWWIAISFLNFLCCYIVLFKVTQNRMAAILGAFIFAFGLFNQSQMSYLQMNIRFAVPFIFYYAWHMVMRPSVKNYFLYCLWLLLQFYSIIYTGILALYLSLIFMGIIVLVKRNWSFAKPYFQHKTWLSNLAITLSTAVALYLLLKPYIEISAITGLRLFWTVVPTLPTLSSWFFAHDSTLTWSFLTHQVKHDSNWFLLNIFPGMLPLLSFFVSGIVLIRQRLQKHQVPQLWLVFFFMTAIVFLLFTRLPNGYSLYAFIFKLPGMNSLRVLSRIMHLQLFFLVVLFALLVTTVLKQESKNKVYVLSILVFAVVITDNLFDASASLRISKKTLQERIIATETLVKTQIQSQHKILALVSRSDDPNAYLTHLDAMLVAQKLHLSCINAYSSYCPDDYGPFFLHPTRKNLEQWMLRHHVPFEQVLILQREE